MSLFTKEQSQQLREYLFNLTGEKRYKLMQVVRILQDEEADQDTIDSAIYHLSKDEGDLNTIFEQMMNSAAVVGEFEEG